MFCVGTEIDTLRDGGGMTVSDRLAAGALDDGVGVT